MEKEDIIKDLESNEQYVPYFSQHTDEYNKEFINYYAVMKKEFMAESEAWQNTREEREVYWMEHAQEQFELIQQKKLFDLQCQWRADKIEIEGIEICFQFVAWSNDIMNCPFIEPVCEADIELFKQFLQTNNTDIDMVLNYNLQDYETIRSAYDSENETANFPEYYEFHNGRTGGSIYLSMPDLAGEREQEYYSILRRKQFHEGTLPKPSDAAARDEDINNLHNINSIIEDFVDGYETHDMKSAYKNFKQLKRGVSQTIEVNTLLQIMFNLWNDETNVSFEADADWKEAMQKTYQKHMCKKLAEYMDIAFAEYLFKKETGLEEEQAQPNTDVQDYINKTIQDFKEAREWNEEHPE